MILKQYYLGCLSHASYLIADERTATAAVVDPQRDVDQYLEDAHSRGLTIRHVLLTHFHADFVSGHLELRDRAGATIWIGARADAEYAFRPMKDGDLLEFGDVRLRFLETPGHTPESVCIVVHDMAAGGEDPHAVLTGDTLFIGDVGRPDLMASVGVSAADLAACLYDSLHGKLLTLPDATLVYPAHGAGSMCGRSLGKETVSTIGDQRRFNYALQPMGRQAFIDLVTSDQPEAPSYFSWDATLNRRERPTLEKSLDRALQPLSMDDALRLRSEGAQVLDVREPAAFAAGHITGSINIGLSGRFATWAGTLLDREKPIVIVADPGREQEAAMRLGRIGFDGVAGFLDGGMAAVGARGDLVSRRDRIAPAGLAAMMASGDPPAIIDVRGAGEWQARRIEGSVNVPLNGLVRSLHRIPRGRPVVVQCESGYRSSIAASLLQRHGVLGVVDLDGGIAAWSGAGLPTVASETVDA